MPAAHHSAREVAAATRSVAHIMFSASKHCCELVRTVTARCCCYDEPRLVMSGAKSIMHTGLVAEDVS